MKSIPSSKRATLLTLMALVALTLSAHLLLRGPNAEARPHVPTAGNTVFTAGEGTAVSFSGQLDRTAVHIDGDRRVKIELLLAAEERAVRAAPRMPTDFVAILDRSGSMSGDKILHARQALRELIGQLDSNDRFALVSYSRDAEAVIPMSWATPRARQRWAERVASIDTGGGTNMSRGMDEALHLASPQSGRAARIILISDGLANQGDSSVEGLTHRAAQAARAETILTTIGVGEDFNELLLSAMADAGTGNYYYLASPTQLASVFTEELAATRETVASNLAVTIEPADGVRVVDAGGYPLEHENGRATFYPGSLFAGQERRVWVTFEVDDHKPGERPLGQFLATFSAGGKSQELAFAQTPHIQTVHDEARFLAAIDKDTWERSVTEEDYGQLRQEVAAQIKAGERGQALEKISVYKAEKEKFNRTLQSEAVSMNLAELEALEKEVEDAFEGTGQAAKQNHLSKSYQSLGRDSRRAGSKKRPDKP